jgi:D-glycero-alpha-D-manno-heptose 1-phosphate guanylyltransferase
MEAIVLAGGLGTRLRGAIGELPKAMAPVAGVPFLDYLLEAIAGRGIARVVLSVGYRHAAIVDHIGRRFASMPIDYVVEEEPLGTGGAIRRALEAVTGDDCFVLNGDTFVDVDLTAMRAHHARAGARLSIAVVAVDDVGRFGSLRIVDSRVTGFVEKGAKGPGTINAGVYLMARDLFDRADLPMRFSFETDFLAARIGALAPLAFDAAGPFIDIGVPDDYRAAPAFFAAIAKR